jgi:adhesin/invasin
MAHRIIVSRQYTPVLTCILALLLTIGTLRSATAQIITTIAGTGTQGYSGDGGPAFLAQVVVYGLAVDRRGDLYLSQTPQAPVIRKIDHTSGNITTIAGNGQSGSSGDGGPAIEAAMEPQALALDREGNIYFTNRLDSVRRVDRETGIVTTIAGTGSGGFSGDGGPATQAQIIATGLTFDWHDNLYIADAGNYRVRKVDRKTGTITTVVGNGTFALSASGSGEGGPATQAGFVYYLDIAFGPHHDLYIDDYGLSNVRRVDRKTNIISTVAGENLAFPSPPLPTGYNGDGIPATQALLNVPTHIAFDCAGNLIISDTFNYRVRRVDRKTGLITTMAGTGISAFSGDGGLATQAALVDPRALAFGPNGDLFIGDQTRVRKVTALRQPRNDRSCDDQGEHTCSDEDNGDWEDHHDCEDHHNHSDRHPPE